MSIQELREKLDDLLDLDSPEHAKRLADDLLWQFIDDEKAEIRYRRIDKWLSLYRDTLKP